MLHPYWETEDASQNNHQSVILTFVLVSNRIFSVRLRPLACCVRETACLPSSNATAKVVLSKRLNDVTSTIRYDTRCYFNVRPKADMSQLNLPHGNDN